MFFRYNDGNVQLLLKKRVSCGLGLEKNVSLIEDEGSDYNTNFFQSLFETIQKVRTSN